MVQNGLAISHFHAIPIIRFFFESTGPGCSEKLCEILGFDLHELSASKTNTSALAFTEDLLYDMVTAFGHGEAFNFGDGNCGNRNLASIGKASANHRKPRLVAE